jgi:hypothetical protein
MEPLDFSIDLILPATLRADAGNTVIGRRKGCKILENASDVLQRDQGFKFTLSEINF